MNADVLRVIDKGDIDNERIVISIIASDDIGHYAVFRSGKNSKGDGITTKVYNTFWFPNEEVKTGDLIVLYTKAGIASSTTNNDGTTTHFYYWGLSSPIWNNDNSVVTLVATPNWKILLQ